MSLRGTSAPKILLNVATIVKDNIGLFLGNGNEALIGQFNTTDLLTGVVVGDFSWFIGPVGNVFKKVIIGSVVDAKQFQATDPSSRAVIGETDFYGSGVTGSPPWGTITVPSPTGGAKSGTAGTSEHPGQIIFTSRAGTANSGFTIILPTKTSLVIAGGETTDFIFKVIAHADTVNQFGFHDTQSVGGISEGIYLELSDTNLSGVASQAGVKNFTQDSYTVTTQTWYRGRIEVNADASEAFFTLFNEAGTVLWSSNLTTFIPTSPTGHGIISYSKGTTARNLMIWDYMSFSINRELER